ncbi:hypothetical protein TrST_g4424 [Triparma strigata]|uniref:non-specific serine/threonine protein kinase n=1 Tax=Triparma strigata TaxID=1606541 RepID=A0A9W7BWB6_9STRA|nr:hypothetical protein TrST_g4424 [Triparma strigata]
MGTKMSKAGKAKKGAAASGKSGGGSGGNDNIDIKLDDKYTSKAGGGKLGIDDFELLKVLGKGSFGKVMLVKKKGGDDTLFAMKTLRKAALIKRNQLLHTATERNILQNIQHPFLVNLIYAFQSDDKLYMVLDYMGGGELFFWLKKHRRFSEARAQLMGAEITLALGALHAGNIIYRDLKPENILVDLEGHIRLTDFGLSKDGITGPGAEGGTKTFCGTPEYLAPEILDNKGHGKSVDWWSFGTLLYEMLCGLPPFYDTNIQKMYHKILCAPLRFPSYLSDNAKEILRGLLQRKVEERLGSGPGGTDEIKAANFFKTLDFDRVMAKEYTPEFKPPAGRNDTDATNFDLEFTTEKAIDSVVTTHMSETAKQKSNFTDFTYQNEGAMGS